MTPLDRLLHYVRRSPDNAIAFVITVIAAYLLLTNLDYVTLWHDESTNALMARSLVNNGVLNGWDGRNLFWGIQPGGQQVVVDDNFNIITWPPWPALPSALGILLFGDNEIGLRLPHAFFGLMCLPLLWLLLKMDFPSRRRLCLLAFALFALSPIFILYARQGRYYPDAIFFCLLSFYCYRRYMNGDNAGWAAGLTIATILGFFNQYTIAASIAISLIVYHLLFNWRHTSPKQWLILTMAGASALAVCGGYLLARGIIGGESLEYSDEAYKSFGVKRKAILLHYHFRDLIQNTWLPLWVALGWLAHIAWRVLKHYSTLQKTSARKKRRKQTDTNRNTPYSITRDERAILRWVTFGALLIAVSALVSVQPALRHQTTDMRYLVMALPFILFASAVFADWTWSKLPAAGGMLTLILLFTNFAGHPFITTFIHKHIYKCPTEPFPLTKLIAEIHRPYPSAITEVEEYLRKNAKQDDYAFTTSLPDYGLLLYYLGDKLKFCCGLPADGESALPQDKVRELGVKAYEGDVVPEWYIRLRKKKGVPGYKKVFGSKAFSYPTQRPEIELRCFDPPPDRGGMSILRRA